MRSVFLERPDPAESSGAHWLRVWWPAVLACVVIVLESTRTMGANNTSRWLRPFFEALLGRMSDEHWEPLHHILRKSGHFLGYGSLCLTFVRGWLLTLGRTLKGTIARWRWSGTWRGVASCASVASCDELHQRFLPNRTGLFSDVVLDTCGGIAMCGLAWVLLRWWRR